MFSAGPWSLLLPVNNAGSKCLILAQSCQSVLSLSPLTLSGLEDTKKRREGSSAGVGGVLSDHTKLRWFLVRSDWDSTVILLESKSLWQTVKLTEKYFPAQLYCVLMTVLWLID